VATDLRLGFLAILVGGLAGFGMGLGTKARGGVGAGFLAGCVAALAIMGSRYGAIHFGVQNYLREQAEVTPEEAVDAVGDEVIEEFMARGVEFEDEDEYYDAVALEAQRRWDALSPEQQQEYMAALSKHYAEESGGQEFAGVATVVMFLVDFGLFGFIWVMLGVGTAYQIGATKGPTENAQAAEGQQQVLSTSDGEGGGFWARMGPPSETAPVHAAQRMDPQAEQRRAAA
jgi:hypothetical protein